MSELAGIINLVFRPIFCCSQQKLVHDFAVNRHLRVYTKIVKAAQ